MFKNARLPCRVVQVVDGDTVKVITRACDQEPWALYSVRISECDTPELRGQTTLEREAAQAAKAYVQDLVHRSKDGMGTLHCTAGQDKFGRLLGDVVLVASNGRQEPRSIGQSVLSNGYGRAYQGGTKEPWSTYTLQRIAAQRKPMS